MVAINITTGGNLEDFWFKLKSWPVGLDSAVESAIDKATDLVRDYIKFTLLEGVALNKRTGDLQRSIQSSRPEPHVGNIFSDGSAPYWSAHEFGTKAPWVIRAINRKTLHFVVDGKDCYPKAVEHPQMKERSFLRRGIKDKVPEIRNIVQAAIRASMEVKP